MRKAAILALTVSGLALGADDNSFFLKGATIHTMAGKDIDNGSILVRDGKIVGVGQNLTAPKGVKAPTVKAKEPDWSHGLDVKCRDYGEKEFGPKTRAFGMEVFRDDNVGATIYIDELGAIAAMPTK